MNSTHKNGMDVRKIILFTIKYGIYILFVIVFCRTAYLVTTISQPKMSVCMDCSAGMNFVHDLGRDFKEPPLIPIFNTQLRTRLLSIPKYPFSNLTSFLLEPSYVCSEKKEILLVILIHSSPYHFERRKAIRRTWTNPIYFNYTGSIFRIFLFGSLNDTLLQKDIEMENQYYSDILQGTFTDSYYNLSFNTMTGLQWVKEKCSKAKVVIKVDDDIMIDMHTVFPKFVLRFAFQSSLVLCSYQEREIVRRKKFKWYMEEDMFKGRKKYPPYCEGKLVMMTKDVVSKLYSLAFKTQYFFIEDVYFYGLVMNRIKKLKVIQMRWGVDFQLRDAAAKECLIKRQKTCSYYASGVSSEQKMEELWSLYIQRSQV